MSDSSDDMEFYSGFLDDEDDCESCDELKEKLRDLKAENERLNVVLHEAVTLADHNLKCYQAVCNDLTKLRKAVDVMRGALAKITQPEKDIGLGCYHESYARQALTETEKILGETDDQKTT